MPIAKTFNPHRNRAEEWQAGAMATPGSVDFDSEEIIIRIADLVVQGVTQEQIGKAFGVAQDRIALLIQMPTFVKIIEEKRRLVGLKYEETNNTWDEVEKLAIKKVRDRLNSFSVDPDFALRTAMMANRAIRRGGNGNLPLGVPAEGRAIINLNQTIINKLVQVNHANAEEAKGSLSEGASATISAKLLPSDSQMKIIDIANPAEIEKMLGEGEDFGLKAVKHLDASLSD